MKRRLLPFALATVLLAVGSTRSRADMITFRTMGLVQETTSFGSTIVLQGALLTLNLTPCVPQTITMENGTYTTLGNIDGLTSGDLTQKASANDSVSGTFVMPYSESGSNGAGTVVISGGPALHFMLDPMRVLDVQPLTASAISNGNTAKFQVQAIFHLRAVPEPGSMTLLAIGAAGIVLGAARRRRPGRRADRGRQAGPGSGA